MSRSARSARVARPVLVIVAVVGLVAGIPAAAPAWTNRLRAGTWDCTELAFPGDTGATVWVTYPWPAIEVPSLRSGPGATYPYRGCDAPATDVQRYASSDGSVVVEGARLTESGLSEEEQWATAPAVGDSGTARAEATRVVLDLGDMTIVATGVEQEATYRCDEVGALPVSASKGYVGSLAITTRKQVGGVTVESTARFGPITKALTIGLEGHGHLMVNARSEMTGTTTYGGPRGWVEQAALQIVPEPFGPGSVPGVVSAAVHYASTFDGEGSPCAVAP